MYKQFWAERRAHLASKMDLAVSICGTGADKGNHYYKDFHCTQQKWSRLKLLNAKPRLSAQNDKQQNGNKRFGVIFMLLAKLFLPFRSIQISRHFQKDAQASGLWQLEEKKKNQNERTRQRQVRPPFFPASLLPAPAPSPSSSSSSFHWC